MTKVIFVIGPAAIGKSCFIEQMLQREPQMERLDVYGYQQRVYEEAGYGRFVPLGEQFRCLAKANALLLDDILEKLEAGCDVVVEQTFYKAKRRIAYIDVIRERFPDAFIAVYVMSPSDERWRENLKKRGLEGHLRRLSEERDDMEFPNVSEGFDAIYQVTDDVAEPRLDPPKPELPAQARAELAEEVERLRREDEERQRREAETLEAWKKAGKLRGEGSA